MKKIGLYKVLLLSTIAFSFSFSALSQQKNTNITVVNSMPVAAVYDVTGQIGEAEKQTGTYKICNFNNGYYFARQKQKGGYKYMVKDSNGNIVGSQTANNAREVTVTVHLWGCIVSYTEFTDKDGHKHSMLFTICK